MAPKNKQAPAPAAPAAPAAVVADTEFDPTSRQLIAEFIGTYILVLSVGCNVIGGSGTWAALSIASSLMVCVYGLGSVSGANFNPAVTLALYLYDAKKTGFNGKKVGAYMATQIVAGILAGLSYLWLHGSAFNLEPGANFTGVHAGAIEILYTFMLCFVVLRTAVPDSKATPSAADQAKGATGPGANEYFGLAIGFVIVAGGYAGGWISKGALNPAVAIGVDVASAGQGVYWCFFYTVFEFVGAALAVLVANQVSGKDSSDSTAVFISEFTGTFFLVLTVGLNVLGNSPAPALSIAASLMCMIYALGGVSGGHFNPAVTTAIKLAWPANEGPDCRCPTQMVPFYLSAQISGAIVAGFVYTSICGASVPLAPAPNHSWSAAAFAEIIFTFTLCFVVLFTATISKKLNQMYGLAIGFVIVAGGYAIGSVSGGSLNPAVSFGLDTSHAFKEGGWMNCLPYTIFELAGAGLAAAAFKPCHEAVGKAGLLPFTKDTYGTL